MCTTNTFGCVYVCVLKDNQTKLQFIFLEVGHSDEESKQDTHYLETILIQSALLFVSCFVFLSRLIKNVTQQQEEQIRRKSTKKTRTSETTFITLLSPVPRQKKKLSWKHTLRDRVCEQTEEGEKNTNSKRNKGITAESLFILLCLQCKATR